MLDQDTIRALFEYRDGALYWKHLRGPVKPGRRAGSVVSSSGRRHIEVNGKAYSEHRLIFAMFTGEWPPLVDHINRDVKDNRIENLRAATKSQNNWNSRRRRDNKSGVKGVDLHKFGRWRARLCVHGVSVHVGMFATKEEAETALRQARDLHHKEFAYHG